MPFTTHENLYHHKTQVTLIFFDDGTVKWEAPANWVSADEPFGYPPRPIENLFPKE